MNGNVFNYKAEGAIPPFRIVKFGTSNDARALSSNGGTTIPAGISTDVGCSAAGDRIDVQEDGEAMLQVLSSVSAGDWLTSDNSGMGIKPTPAGNVIALAKESGAAGEIIRVNIVRFYKAS
jgi:hypothetical protein